MKSTISHLLIILAIALATPIRADDTAHIDDTVAAGIVFKIGYLFGGHGTWNSPEPRNPESFQKAMNSISKDLSHFSKTKRGVTLQKKGQNLINFLSRGVRLTSRPDNHSKPDTEADKFFEDLGLDPQNRDPAQLAQIFTDRIAAYAQISNTPEWVYNPNKRNGNTTPQPATTP